MIFLSEPVRLARRLAALVVVACLAATPAHAALQNPVALQLLAPGGTVGDATPIAVPDAVDPATGIQAGDSSNIGGSWMLPGEFIRFVGNSIRLHVAAGDDTGGVLTTGYRGAGGVHAQYSFSGLNIPGQLITGIQTTTFDGFGDSGFSGVQSGTGVTLTSPTSLSFNLDDLVFVNRGGGSSNSYAEFRVDLLTTAIPEPASWALFAGGLLLLSMAVRIRRRGAAGADRR